MPWLFNICIHYSCWPKFKTTKHKNIKASRRCLRKTLEYKGSNYSVWQTENKVWRCMEHTVAGHCSSTLSCRLSATKWLFRFIHVMGGKMTTHCAGLTLHFLYRATLYSQSRNIDCLMRNESGGWSIERPLSKNIKKIVWKMISSQIYLPYYPVDLTEDAECIKTWHKKTTRPQWDELSHCWNYWTCVWRENSVSNTNISVYLWKLV